MTEDQMVGWHHQAPGDGDGQRSLACCSPWGHEESDMIERLHFHFSFSCIGEGDGNPLQCSYLENPRDAQESSPKTQFRSINSLVLS